MSDKYRKIWAVIGAIPTGQVASYGQVAELAGMPRKARLVVRALRAAPRRLELPWHRVVNAQGKISIPAGTPGHSEQLRRLEKESVRVIDGRVDLEQHHWKPGLDELVWGPPAWRDDG